MRLVRQPAVSGLFYPDQVKPLIRELSAYLKNAKSEPVKPLKALIVPHAGYVYSGSIAASGYRLLQNQADQIKRVILLGPAHRLGFSGMAYSSDDAFATPLGEVPIDQNARNSIRDLPQVHPLDAAFEDEHCLEVQYPFLQSVLDNFKLLPLLVGDASHQAVAELLEKLWGNDDTLILISSDLSHFLDYKTAQTVDSATTKAIESFNDSVIGPHQACGHNPIGGLLQVAKRRNLQVKTLDQRNSGDTAGSKDRVVGYASYAFF